MQQEVPVDGPASDSETVDGEQGVPRVGADDQGAEDGQELRVPDRQGDRQGEGFVLVGPRGRPKKQNPTREERVAVWRRELEQKREQKRARQRPRGALFAYGVKRRRVDDLD